MIEQWEIDQRFSELLQKKKRLLKSGETNQKLAKNTVPTWILNLSPHKQNNAGKNLCPHASPGCSEACLSTSGMGRFTSVEYTRRLNTEVFLQYQKPFLQLLQQELWGLHLEAKATGQPIAVRTNGTTDVLWFELFEKQLGIDVLNKYDGLIFYNYTKSYSQWEKYKDSRYHLTFSASELNWLQCQWVIHQGGTVAVVFDKVIPDLYGGFPVFEGDSSDQRWLDPPGHIIGLTYKKAKNTNVAENKFIVKAPSAYLQAA